MSWKVSGWRSVCFISLGFLIFREEAAPPLPIVVNRYSDEQLRTIIKRMRERLQICKDKVADQYASSPEISPPVSECEHKHLHPD